MPKLFETEAAAAARQIFANLWSLRRRIDALGGEYGDEAAQATAAVVRDIQRAHPRIARDVSRCFAMRRAALATQGIDWSRRLFPRA